MRIELCKLANTNRVIGLLSAVLLVGGCTPSKRGVQVGPQAVVAKIHMIGLDSRFASDENVVYEMSTCVSPFNGTKGIDGVITFSAPGLKKAAQCQIKVKTLRVDDPGITFTTEPSVLYWARSVTLSEDTSGALMGTALLQQTYGVVVPAEPSKIFSLSIPVKFPDDKLPPGPVTANLDCAPLLENPSLLKATTAANASFEFVVEFTANTKYKCTNIWVSSAGDGRKYVGKWIPDGTTAEVTAGVKLSLPKVDLNLVPPVVVDPTGITVSTKPGSCEAGKVYNSTTRVCE